jgi:hypothetical protein
MSDDAIKLLLVFTPILVVVAIGLFVWLSGWDDQGSPKASTPRRSTSLSSGGSSTTPAASDDWDVFIPDTYD